MTFLSVALYLLLVGLMKIWSPSSIEVGIISTLQECYWVGLGGRLRAGSGIFSPHLLRIFAICCPHSPYISLPTLVSTRGGGGGLLKQVSYPLVGICMGICSNTAPLHYAIQLGLEVAGYGCQKLIYHFYGLPWDGFI